VFSSKESLKATIEELQSESTEKVEQEFETHYEKGFRSHKPIINPKNELLQAKLSEEIMQKRQLKKSSGLYNKSSGEDDEEEDEFIGDPLLAALVNDNDEIIVNDTIYKFTEEKGLFFAHVKDSTYLLDYFKEANENANKSSSISSKSSLIDYPVDYCDERANYGGITPIDDKISRYVAPIEIEDDCYGGGGSGGGNPSPVPQISEEEELLNFVNGLTDCDVKKPIFQNIFGRTFVCIDYFDSKHRIKTEFWDQNYLFYQSVGIQTKVQTKKLWVWWASDANVIYLGINRILLKYNFPQPEINSYTHPQLFPVNSYKNPIYMWDGKFNINTSSSSLFPTFVETQLKIPSGNLPFFKIEDSEILNIYIPKVFNKGKYKLNLSTEDITSKSNIKELYKMGIDFLNSPKVANSGSKPNNFSVIYQKDYNNIEVIYFGELYKKTNTNDLKRTLYNSGANFVIGYAWTEGPRAITTTETDIFGNTTTVNLGTDYSFAGKFKLKPIDDFFRDYTYYDLDFYAVGKRGNTWAGSRMIKSEEK
jgi:hypothetical protein